MHLSQVILFTIIPIASSLSMKRNFVSKPFRAVKNASDAQNLKDGVELTEGSIMPWVGFGTYRLGKDKAFAPTLQALSKGYRCIDTAFIYASEQTEKQVGDAIKTAIERKIIESREEVFVITKHWRKYHGYSETLQCLNLSLDRLQLDFIDLYLIHWPGPAYNTMSRRKDVMEEQGPWAYANVAEEDMVKLRSETWRAMEDALNQGKVKSIGVSNFTIRQLENLKKTAKLWPPAVNQVESHPLYPNNELRDYCAKEGIIFQAYAALGGQDGTKKKWKELLNGEKLLSCTAVEDIAKEINVSPAQVLLRYALQRNCAITPKTVSAARMEENSNIFHFELSDHHMNTLNSLEVPGDSARLCWRTDPLRMLDFD